MSKYGPMMEANKAKTPQVKALIANYPNAKIPTKIRVADKQCYTMICLIVGQPDQNGITKISANFPTVTQNLWEARTDNTNKGFNCHVAAILHDPTIKEAPKKKRKKTEETTTEEIPTK